MRIFPLKPSVHPAGSNHQMITVPPLPAIEPAPAPPPPDVFTANFDDTFWATADGVTAWDGTKWEGDGFSLLDSSDLQAIGGWNAGYTPTSIRVTISASAATNVDVYVNSGGTQQVLGNVAISTVPTAFTFPLVFPLDRPPGDLVYLSAVQNPATLAPWNFIWNNIEFSE